MTLHRVSLAVAALALLACTTPATVTSTSATSVKSGPQTRLENFSGALAAVGMSVPLPARVCDERAAAAIRYDDDIGCVEVSSADDDAEALRVYARAIVKARSRSGDDDGRADILVDSYIRHDDARFTAVALSVEADFDAARLKKPATRVAASTPKGKPSTKTDKKSDAVVDAGVPREADGHEPTKHDDGGAAGDAGPGELSVKDKIIGTWFSEEGPLRNIYAFCETGDYIVKYEMLDESLSEFAGSMPLVHGKWAAHEGDPPTLELSALGESMTATIGTLTEDALEITLEGDATNLTRRSKTASCE